MYTQQQNLMLTKWRWLQKKISLSPWSLSFNYNYVIIPLLYKYKEQLEQMWKVTSKVVPIVMASLGAQQMPGTITAISVQNSVALGTVKTLHRTLNQKSNLKPQKPQQPFTLGEKTHFWFHIFWFLQNVYYGLCLLMSLGVGLIRRFFPVLLLLMLTLPRCHLELCENTGETQRYKCQHWQHGGWILALITWATSLQLIISHK